LSLKIGKFDLVSVLVGRRKIRCFVAFLEHISPLVIFS
jgi:hypothetical protein